MKRLFYKLTMYHRKGRISKSVPVFCVLVLPILLQGCSDRESLSGIPSLISPRGPAASSVNNLWWAMFGIGTAVFVVVMGLLLYFVFARRRNDIDPSPEAIDTDAPENRSWIWFGGVIVPTIILAVTLFLTLRSLAEVARSDEDTGLHFVVVGKQWFWEISNPDMEFTTANELHIPVGRPVRLSLTSADVIHSFWVPELHGKMDLIPGRTNEFWIQADEPGIYRGICAEYCGQQHAHMQFLVVAESDAEFNQWLEQERAPAVEPADELAATGKEAFMNLQCHFCHTIRGTDADGSLGPDLTHFGSRLTIAAGMLENNRGNIGGWVAHPQSIKPGNLMPVVELSSEDLRALIAYLESLE